MTRDCQAQRGALGSVNNHERPLQANMMMEKCKSDTAMMSTMCKTMMGNKEMTDMMEKMKKGNEDMKKMGNMHKMPGMDKKATK